MKPIVKSKIELAAELVHSLTEFRTSLRHFIQEKIRENQINLTYEMLEILSLLWKKDGLNQQEIADKTLRDKSSMTYLIDNLVRRAMVVRTEDENDRRNRLIFLTAEGRALREKLLPWLDEVFEAAAVKISISELKAGTALMDKMTGNIKRV